VDITFNCDKCGQSIVIDELGAGRQVECPKCKSSVTVPVRGDAANKQTPKVYYLRPITGAPPSGPTAKQVLPARKSEDLGTARTMAFEKVMRHVQAVESPDDLTIRGEHLAITLTRLWLNVQLFAADFPQGRKFVLLEAVFENLWDYRLGPRDNDFSMVDSDGWQHKTSQCYRPDRMRMPTNRKIVQVDLPRLSGYLEGRAKVKGWIIFDALPLKITPRRFIYTLDVYAPGHTSGWVQCYEFFEFALPDFSSQHRLSSFLEITA